MTILNFETWAYEYRPRYFYCGDGYHECDEPDDDGEHEHGKFLYPVDPMDPEELTEHALESGRVWSWLPDGSIALGVHPAAEWLLETEKAATGQITIR